MFYNQAFEEFVTKDHLEVLKNIMNTKSDFRSQQKIRADVEKIYDEFNVM